MNRKSILFTGPNQLEVVEEPCPQPGDGELLVQTCRSVISTGTEGICFTRNFAPGTHWDHWVKYPFRTGYLNAGRVVAVGKAVQGWNVGDRVASRSGHSSHVTVAPSLAARVPDGVSDESAAWMGLGKIVQIGVRASQPTMGDHVAVIGLGLLGQLVVQYLRLMGAWQVIAIDTAPRRLEMAASHGATHTLCKSAGDALEDVRRLTAGRGADVVYEVTGHPAVFAQALPLARRFGTVVLLGDTGNPQQQTLTADLITRGLRVVGAHDSHPPHTPTDHTPWSIGRMNELFLTYLARGQMRVDDLITHRYRPDDAAEAYAMLQRERLTAMGVVFEWEQDGRPAGR